MRSAALLLAFSAAGIAGTAAAQQPAPTAPPQSVVVPSLPDQRNKEATVQPSNALQTDEAGWVKNGPAADPKAGGAAAGGAAKGAVGPVGPGVGFPPPPAAGPAGPAVVAAANLSIRGVVKAYEKGKSITVLEANGRTKTVPLAGATEVFEGLKAGDKVVVRIPLGAPADGKTADRVERQKTPAAPPKSKFSQAQSPAG
jgi:hypothetical protein